jgi:hypothetical protein
MAIERQRLGAPVGHDSDARVPLEGIGEVDKLTIDHAGQRRLGEPWRDTFGHIEDTAASGYGAAGAIRKRDGDLTHGKECVEAHVRLGPDATKLLRRNAANDIVRW